MSVRRSTRKRDVSQKYKEFLASHTLDEDDEDEENDGKAGVDVVEPESKDAGGDADDDDNVQCLVCGTTNDNYDEETDGRDMIQCDSCHTWQHNECVLQPKKPIPKIYNCNVCDPTHPRYKNLVCKIDPHSIKTAIKNSKKSLPKSNVGATAAVAAHKEEGEDDEEFKSDSDHQEDADDDDADADDDDDDADEGELDAGSRDDTTDADFSVSRKERKSAKRSNQAKRALVSTPSTSSKRSKGNGRDIDDLTLKARNAVKKRFEGMLSKLFEENQDKLPFADQHETAIRWAQDLENELYKANHDLETLKLTKDYKEGSARIFVNVKDVKNSKLRQSILNKAITFARLVRLPVNELLNPDLKKEKEEAIRESMTQATIERVQVSNIRRTHKGDVLIENDDADNNSNNFDFNVGINMDNDDKKFINSESNVNNERKNSIYNNSVDYEEEEIEQGKSFTDNFDDRVSDDETTKHALKITNEDDDEFAKLLSGEHKHVNQESDDEEYDPAKALVDNGPEYIWQGQTIFTGVTNFQSTIEFKNHSLDNLEKAKAISNYLIDKDSPLEIEGRLDTKKADDYLNKIATSKKFVLLEIKPVDDEESFKKLFSYFYMKAKYGVLKLKKDFVKDAYLIPVMNRLPSFHSWLKEKWTTDSKERLFILFVIKPESATLRECMHPNPTFQTPNFEFLSRLNSIELQVVNNIFNQFPKTRTEPSLLIQHLQKLTG